MISNKFTFIAFNYIIYNWKISNFLIARHLFELFNYYTLLDNIKFLNLVILLKGFFKFAIYISKLKLDVNDFVKLYY